MKAKFELTESDIRKAVAAWVGGTKRVNASEADVTLVVVDRDVPGPGQRQPFKAGEKFGVTASVEVKEF